MADSILCGLIGAGIQGSRTPRMHEQEAAAQGLKYVYTKFDLDELKVGVEALPELLTDAERMGYTGLNITYPCKQAILPLLHELADDARAIGAVNTVLLKHGKRLGHNTDCAGFAAGFRRALADVKAGRAVQLGAGGAGAAVARAAIVELGIRQLTIFDVDPAKAMQLAAKLGPQAQHGENLPAAMATADGLIHCTPIGMSKLPGLPLPATLLRSEHWVAEIVYVPLETELLKVARSKGCRTADGSGMAVYQAAGAFELFTGIAPDVDRMFRHFASMGS
jgi:shikimate dehydrogenase